MVEPTGSAIASAPGAAGHVALLQREIDRIQSREVAIRAAESMHLSTNPAFSASNLPFGERLARLVGWSHEEPSITLLRNALSVESLDGSRLIAVRFAATDADYAAWAANNVTEAYLTLARQEGLEAESDKLSTLSQRLETQRKRTLEAESAVEAKRVEARILTIRAMMANNVGSSKPLTVAATIDPAEQARRLREGLKAGVQPEMADVEGDAALARLVDTRLRLEATLQQESKTLLDGHPRIKALKADLAMVKSRSAAAIQRYLAVLDAQADQGLDLTGSIPAVEAPADPLAVAPANLQTLEAHAATEREALDALLADYRAAAQQSSAAGPGADVSVLSWAQAPIQAEGRSIGPGLMAVVAALLALVGVLFWRFRPRDDEKGTPFLRPSLTFDHNGRDEPQPLAVSATAPIKAA
jgi:uncharacterized protein involved in exopolysaccharide biosynthesis